MSTLQTLKIERKLMDAAIKKLQPQKPYKDLSKYNTAAREILEDFVEGNLSYEEEEKND